MARKNRPKSTTQVRKWRAANPVRAAYLNLKSNAKRRKIFFDLTFKQFEVFLYDTEYMKRKGRGANNLTIDRIRVLGGYTFANMDILTKSQNSIKRLNEYSTNPNHNENTGHS